MRASGRAGAVLAAVVLVVAVFGCSKSSPPPDEQADAAKTPPPSAHPVAEHYAKQMEKQQKGTGPVGYEDAVTSHKTEGQADFDTIKSSYPCTAHADCTSTKFTNVPTSDADCQCATPCTPDVVNKAEKERRETANRRFCQDDDWYGPNCPAPPCSFLDFDEFKCLDGVCHGLAVGRN